MSKERIKIKDGLFIYKQENSKFWWCDLNLKNGTGRARFSTKQTDADEAEAEALIWYENAKIKGSAELAIFGHKKTITEAVLRAIEENDRKKTKTKNANKVMLLDILDKFKNTKAKNINVDVIREDIMTKNSNTRRTMRKSCWTKIMQAASDLKIYDNNSLPRIPEIEKNDEEKPHVSESDLILIAAKINLFIESSKSVVSKENRKILKDYLKFIYLTGARAGEEVLKTKFSDINENYIKIKNGKVHSKNKEGYREAYLNKRTLMLLKRRAEKLNIKFNKKHRHEEFIFQREDGTVPKLDVIFPQLLEFCKIEKGKYRAYSFRKNYITKQLEKGANINVVAIQCGTSIEMINKYYNKSNIRDLSHQLK